eukprot:NODE_2263_length_1165_cov_4.849462_g1876_i0.p9 GENE.NODE_2263_length_1165_cov_4.849462_g1876_i0~~NODE_2263_length_1165_cov_4.849462_g1876_i0.p9  ORF type:complete len:62 (-),score=2.94 NODE_2263_length_1165_cov_4.849462_g1876_i0:862-1047(-)
MTWIKGPQSIRCHKHRSRTEASRGGRLELYLHAPVIASKQGIGPLSGSESRCLVLNGAVWF